MTTYTRRIRLLEDADQSFHHLLRTARKTGDEEDINNYVFGVIRRRGLEFEIVGNKPHKKISAAIYTKRVLELADMYMIIQTCKTCGSPVNKGYVCPFCDDNNPTSEE